MTYPNVEIVPDPRGKKPYQLRFHYLETPVINREAKPGDTVFAEPAGLRATSLFDALFEFKEKGPKESKGVLRNYANDLIASPEKLIKDYVKLRELENDHPEIYSELCQQFRIELDNIYPNMASKQAKTLNLSERHIRSFFQMYSQTDLIEEGKQKAQQDIKHVSEIIMRGLVEGSKTDGQIANFFYHIALAGLSVDSEEAEKKAYQILSFSSPIITVEDFQAVQYALASVSQDDDALGKFIWASCVTDMFEDLYDLDETSKKNALKIKEDPRHEKEIEKIRGSGLTSEQKERFEALVDYYQEAAKFDFDEDVPEMKFDITDYTDSLGFPEHVSAQPYKLRYLYEKRYSRHLKEQGKIEHDTIVLTMPHDNSARTILFLTGKGDPRFFAADVLEVEYHGEGIKRKVDNINSVCDVLKYLWPFDLSDQKEMAVEQLNQEKRNALFEAPRVYGLHPRGDQIMVDDSSVSVIKSIVFKPGNKFGTKVALTIGKYTLPLYLDHHYHLKAADGSELAVDSKALAWWETIILSYLQNLLCESKTVECDGYERLATEETEADVIKNFFGRREHRRLLPGNQKFTEQQSIRFQEKYGMTLKQYNELFADVMPPNRYYTWVFPNEVPVDEQTPPVIFRSPKAEDNLKQALQ